MLNIAQLLLPISAAHVCGDDISFSSEVDDIAKARQHDDPTLDQGAWVVALREADWPFVAARCAALIESKSKDLRLAAWLAEANARIHHFRGLGDGYALLAGLCERYWDALHPAADDGRYEQRTGNLAWLLARTPQLVKAMPVTEDGAVTMASFDLARQRLGAEQGAEQGWSTERPRAPAGPTLEELDAARRRNSAPFNDALLAGARYCLASLQELERVVDAQLGADGPAFGAARDALLNAIDFIEPLASQPDGGAEPDGVPHGAPAGSGTAAGGGNATIQTRAQALAQLRLVAAFFRRTEPHSPVAYLADKAAAWGELPLHLWLRAVVKDQGTLAQLDEMLGSDGTAG